MNEFSDDEYEFQDNETLETHETRETDEIEETSTQHELLKRKKIKKGGPKLDEIWEYFIQGNETNPGHYKATCYYCSNGWARGKPSTLKAHLANNCVSCPDNIRKYWQDKLADNNIKYTRSLKDLPVTKEQQKITHHFGSSLPLSPQKNKRIDHTLLKAWIMAGIPFDVIENPFVLDLFKELNSGYTPPSRFTLSERLLDEEVSRVNQKVESELEAADSLTLSKYYNKFLFINL